MTEAKPSPSEERRETALKAQLREQFEQGKRAAQDPANAELPELCLRTTTIYSRWFTLTCPECKHTFREEDKVRLCPECGQAYHDDAQYGLHCWQQHFAAGRECKPGGFDPFTEIDLPGCSYQWNGELPDTATTEATADTRILAVTTQFQVGLRNEWTAFGDAQVIEVQPGSSLVGRKCPWCKFDIRAGDRVVKCPCGHCNTYFHDDVFRHLTCWNAWNGSRGSSHCPTTGAPLVRPPVEGQDG
ncbi:MAG: hypothetical protein RBT75_18880 [Anaerolineae bacterium]|jgi:hypothetical protein|nr:hypothetical protein [Anaerolineae bacterium]